MCLSSQFCTVNWCTYYLNEHRGNFWLDREINNYENGQGKKMDREIAGKTEGFVNIICVGILQ